jgi:hypothetical protein
MNATEVGNWQQSFTPSNPNSWVTASQVPPTNANVLFDGSAFGGTNNNSQDCVGFHVPSGQNLFNTVQLINSYSGTVTLGDDAASGGLSINSLNITSGAISQPDQGLTDLTVLSSLNWSGGNLGDTKADPNDPLFAASNANVNFNGAGTITLPTNGALYSGDTINFNNPTAANVSTIISGAGSLLLNGGIGMNVNADAKVKNVVSPGAAVESSVNSNLKSLTLASGTEWGYVGAGTDSLGLMVFNNAGKFYLGDPLEGRAQVTLQVGIAATTFGYTQNSNATNATLQIMAGSTLDASGTKGVEIDGGQIWLAGNTDLTMAQQTATIKGTYTMTGGSINFLSPVQATDGQAQLTFEVTGNASWSGGTYNPGIDCIPGDPAKHDTWTVVGILTINTAGASKPTINPVAQGGQPNSGNSWPNLIIAGAVDGNLNLSFPAGWTLNPDVQPNGLCTGFDMKKN